MSNQDIYYNWSDGGGAIIRPVLWHNDLTEGGYALFEVPNYGGEPRYFATFKTLEEAKAQADKWT